jgi:uncharacterized membrane protein YcaP (DUF421 family)
VIDWLSKVFDHPDLPGIGIIAAKTLVIYVFLIIGLRLLGKRELGQMNIFDLILLIVLGNAVQNAMMNNDNSLGGGLVAATVLLIVNRVFNFIMRRSRKVERLMVGQPVLLVNNGIAIEAHLQTQGISHEQLMQALREHGICTMAEAGMCVLEVDGSISVVPAGSDVLRSKRHFKALRLS